MTMTMTMTKDAFQFGIEPVRITDTDNLQINEGLPTNADPQVYALELAKLVKTMLNGVLKDALNRPGFPGECFICELRLPDHRFRWKHNKLFLLLPEEYGPAFPAIVDCYTSPPT